jgi:MFS family permease
VGDGADRKCQIHRDRTLVSAASCAAIGFANWTHFFVIIFAVAGAANGLIQPGVNVYIVQQVPQRFRGLSFGLRVAGTPAAGALAALAGSVMTAHSISWRLFFLVGAVFVIGLSVIAFVQRPGRLTNQPSSQDLPRRRPALTALILSGSGFLASTATSVLATFLATGLVWKGTPPATATLVVSIAGAFALIAPIFIGLAADRLDSPRVHLGSTAGMIIISGAGMVLMGLISGQGSAVFAGIVAYGFGWAWPGLLHFAALMMHPHSHRAVASQMQFATFAGAILGPMVFGYLVNGGYQVFAWSFLV